MNEFVSTLIKRRSMRAFKAEQITEEMLDDILYAGLHAPSAANRQPIILVAITDKENRDKVMKMNQKVLNKYDSDPYYGAPTIILVLAKADIPTGPLDGALCLGNMYNAAFSMGLGECWIHREQEMFSTNEGKDFLKQLGVEQDVIGIGALAVGYADKEFAQEKEILPDRVIRA